MNDQTTDIWTSLSKRFAAAAEETSKLVVSHEGRGRFSASGLAWRPGIIVTAAHTIRHDAEIPVTLPDGRSATAAVAGIDRGTDIAVLRAGDVAAAPVRAAAPDSSRVGHLVVAVGRSPRAGTTASLGIVSAVSGAWRTWRGGRIESLIRLDVTPHPGLSGSAVVNADGTLAGMATTGLSRFGAIVIPAVTVERVMDDLLNRGRVPRPYLGVALHPVTLPAEARARHALASDDAMVVLGTEPAGPAARAGVTVGDIIVMLNGKPVADLEAMQSALEEIAPGGAANVALLRGGSRTDVEITVGERPARGERR